MATVSSCTLSPTYFTKAWQQLTDEHFDMIIIGGGSVGAGTALDAATRGLKVALIEARDFAAGTSSRSSKMFHGGLRYLAMLDFRLVAESLRERELSMSVLAPHLVIWVYALRPHGRSKKRTYAKTPHPQTNYENRAGVKR